MAVPGQVYVDKVMAEADLSATRQMVLKNLQNQRKKEVEQLKSTLMKQLKKSVQVEKMPSVRVRPTLRVELKHRVLNCKMTSSTSN